MTKLVIFKEKAGETRVALVPADVQKLLGLGYQISVEAGAGELASFNDDSYRKVGAEIVEGDALQQAKASADVLVRIQKPSLEDLDGLREDALHLSFLDPFKEKELLQAFAKGHIKAVSLEMIPRTTLAQKMDVLSSQTSLAGYAAVILAASKMPQIFPMMMTPSGNISPVRVFVIGVGVAGLQVIATAKRLGARVEAFDTRVAVEEQVKSLGARFLKIDLGEDAEDAKGYASELTPEQIKKQQDAQAKVCAKSDLVITTAKVFGRQAPILLTEEMLAAMKPGSLVIDMAVATGGNVVGSDPEREIITENGVRIIGADQLERLVPLDASNMFSGNIRAFLEHFTDSETKELQLPLDEKILRECLITTGGEIVHERFKN
ncbi:MAG: NAD(P) transhydrogenase subunit alpha [Eubacteriales bacterium]|nr:NAD(P) transhydrogenase subunit alpha [Eubacteriales bacterium]